MFDPLASDLPVVACLPDLLATLQDRPNAVLVAPPGAGKTTLVPAALLGAPWRGDGRIVMLEPRRLAARAAATRMAALAGEKPGETFGFRTRLESAVSARTRVEVVTEGVMLRQLLNDPTLEGIAAVIFDEVHERALELDLALTLCLDLQRMLRPDLRLLAMSATADGARLSAVMDAPLIESEGRMFPVTIRHEKRDIAQLRDLPDATARAVRGALAEHEGDILVFLPGMGEIRRTQAALAGCGALVLPLHGDLPPAEQDRALNVADQRRVVLATSIAETSLTVPGVRVVIDGGWRRAPALDPSTGLSRLTTRRISKAAATQRAGRAGRLAPGVAIRLWSEALHRGLPAFDRPEILEAELSSLRLDCAVWGTSPAELPFPDPPPAGALAAGEAVLERLGAMRDGRVTPLGQRMARLGAHPRLAAMMLAARSLTQLDLAATLAALLEERDPLRRGPDSPADIGLRLEAVAHGAPEADRGALMRIRQAASRYRARLHDDMRREGLTLPPGTEADEKPGPLLAAGFPDRIAQSRGDIGSFRLAGGGGAKLPRADKLSGEKLLAVAGMEAKTGTRITLAARLAVEDLPDNVRGDIVETVENSFDPVGGAVISRRRRRLGALVLEDRLEQTDPSHVATLLADALAERPQHLPWTDTARQFQARVEWMRTLDPTYPDLADDALHARIRDWLGPHLHGLARLEDVARLDLAQILRLELDYSLLARLDRDLPTHLDLPGGRAAVDYTQPVPLAAARAQHFYGLTSTPVLAGGRVALRLALLSPAGRPAAITADLAAFWTGAWIDTRKDLRGRYPKHEWPENPGLAPVRVRVRPSS